MDLQEFLHLGIRTMLVGRTINILTDRVKETVCIQNVKIDEDLIVLKTDKDGTREIKLSLSSHEFCFPSKEKYSITYSPETGCWKSYECNGVVDVKTQ